MRARAWISHGRLDEAAAWARQRGLTPSDALSYLREYEHLTLVRLLIARARAGGGPEAAREAAELLGRLLAAAEAGGRKATVIECLALQALAAQVVGDNASAMEPLRRALDLAEAEGFVRVFLDEGAAMAELLRAAAKLPGGEYAKTLLGQHASETASSAVADPGIEPLSERERDVLRLLASELSGPEIANQLVVSLNTVRTHTKNVYAKLGVNSRRAAVRRAEELGLL